MLAIFGRLAFTQASPALLLTRTPKSFSLKLFYLPSRTVFLFPRLSSAHTCGRLCNHPLLSLVTRPRCPMYPTCFASDFASNHGHASAAQGRQGKAGCRLRLVIAAENVSDRGCRCGPMSTPASASAAPTQTAPRPYHCRSVQLESHRRVAELRKAICTGATAGLSECTTKRGPGGTGRSRVSVRSEGMETRRVAELKKGCRTTDDEGERKQRGRGTLKGRTASEGVEGS